MALKDERAGGSKYSAKFSAPDAEVTFQSSDNVLFKIHQKELSITSGGFDPPPNADFQEVVGLSEDEETLELLFQFVYPSMTPDISTISFSLLDRLCEAAHKYQVYSAMDLCSLYMNEVIAEQSIQVFRFSVRHGYMDIASRAAPLVIDEPLDSVVEKIGFSPTETLLWLRYCRSWSECQKAAITNLCPQGAKDYRLIVEKLCGRLRSLQDLDSVFGLRSWFSSKHGEWRKNISRAVASIPKFADIFYKDDNEKLDMNENKDPSTPVFYQSVDNVVLSSDREWLRTYSSTLSETALATSSMFLPHLLSETSAVLRDLFRYISPSKNPNSLNWDLDHIRQMAEAVEKYQILPAMRVCYFYMRKNLRLHPDIVFRHGVAYSYPELMNAAAPLVLKSGPYVIASMLPKESILSWISYHEHWSGIARDAVEKRELLNFEEVTVKTGRGPTKEQTFRECSGCSQVLDITDIVCEFAEGPQSLLRLDDILDISEACCDKRKTEMLQWKDAIQEKIDAIPPFSEFID